MTTDTEDYVPFDPHTPDFILPQPLSATELMGLTLPPRELLLDPILPSRGLAMLYGPRGLGKTHVALGIAWAAASGERFLKWHAEVPRRVLYVDGEMPATDMQERLRLIGPIPTMPPPPGLSFLLADMLGPGMPDLGTLEGQGVLERTWGETPPELLVIDNLSSLVGSARDNDADGWSIMQNWLLRLRRKGVCVLIVHHAGKGGQQRGTSRREDVLDMVIALRRPSDYEPKDGARFEVHLEKARGLYGPVTDPFEARLQPDALGTPVWNWEPLRDAEFARAVALFKDGISPGDAAEELGVSRATAYRLKKKAIREGHIEK
ncbi:MAG: AAA family ATPase [Enhydrobacter sp.]